MFGRSGPARPRDYGLLREVAVTPSKRAATTVTAAERHGLRVLVFPFDGRRAVQILLNAPWPTPDP